jgi:predicted metal-dependent hydrolase
MKFEGSSHAIGFGRERISFNLFYGDHDRFQITVKPDMKVEVQAPAGKPLETVLFRVRKRASWIVKQLHFFEEFQPRAVAKRFVSGETFRYLGRQYRLKIIHSMESRVHLSRPFIRVYLPNPKNAGAVESLVGNWYQERAKEVLGHRLDSIYEEVKGRLRSKPTLRVRHMIRRWGSCTNSNLIVLNTSLVQAPMRCIDYVILHELCHLSFHDHSRKFWRLLTRSIPDWELAKKHLESISILRARQETHG